MTLNRSTSLLLNIGHALDLNGLLKETENDWGQPGNRSAAQGTPCREDRRRRELCRRFHGDALARAVFPEPA